MSRPHDAQWTFLPFGNPFRIIFPKSSDLSPELLSLLNAFEQTLAERLRKLKPKNCSDVLSLSWLRQAMQLLSETHANIKTLTAALDFPCSDWDEKWIYTCLDDSTKLLDICNGLTSELLRLGQGQLYLKYALHILASIEPTPSSEQLDRVHSLLHDWMARIHSAHSKSLKLEQCSSILEELTFTLHLVKVKNSAKGKVLMRALYGVKIVTIFVCSVFTAALPGCSKQPMNLEVFGEFSWAKDFNDLQAIVNGQINQLLSGGKLGVPEEVEAVNQGVEKLHEKFYDSSIGTESSSDLAKSAECLVVELDLLSKQLEGFFKLVFAGHGALHDTLRASLFSSLTASSDVQF